MRAIVRFTDQQCKGAVFAPFLTQPSCRVNEEELVLPGVIKVDQRQGALQCFCLDFITLESLLSRVCQLTWDDTHTTGRLTWPPSLAGALLELELTAWDTLLAFATRCQVVLVDTATQQLDCNVRLTPWLHLRVLARLPSVVLHFSFYDHELVARDPAAGKRVQEHPLLAAGDFLGDLGFTGFRLQPRVDYLTFWKVLHSEQGYKRYAQFLNDAAADLDVTYEPNKGYHCVFAGGKVDFQLLALGDRYPRKVLIQLDDLHNTPVLTALRGALSLRTLELTAKVSYLRLDLAALQRLGFNKHDDFFLFTRQTAQVQWRYDIGAQVLTAKRDLNVVQDWDVEAWHAARDELRTLLTEVLTYAT